LGDLFLSALLKADQINDEEKKGVGSVPRSRTSGRGEKEMESESSTWNIYQIKRSQMRGKKRRDMDRVFGIYTRMMDLE